LGERGRGTENGVFSELHTCSSNKPRIQDNHEAAEMFLTPPPDRALEVIDERVLSESFEQLSELASRQR